MTLGLLDWTNFVFAFHDGEEIGPRMVPHIAKHTGLVPDDHEFRACVDSARPPQSGLSDSVGLTSRLRMSRSIASIPTQSILACTT
jgi:hypothetical protein